MTLQTSDFINPVKLAKLLVAKGLLSQEEYKQLIEDSASDNNMGGAC